MQNEGIPEVAATHCLAGESALCNDTVNVSVLDGWITLFGNVDWYYQKKAAENNLRNLSGVTGVSNTIAINPKLSDQDIRENISNAIHRSYLHNPSAIDVTALGGRVRLSGTVTSLHDRIFASETAWNTPGTIMVDNDLMVV